MPHREGDAGRGEGAWYLHGVSVSDIWLAALCPSGEVLGVGGGAPEGWVGAALDGRKGVPALVQEAARAVVAEARGGRAVARRVVDAPELGASVELVAVAAVGLRRAATEVRALLRRAVEALERQARALDVGLGVTVDPGTPDTVFVDPQMIAWAVSTLVGNAMRYVRCGTRQMPGGNITVIASHDAARAELCLVVEDDGPGIPAGVLEGLLQRRPGAPSARGLALEVVRDVVEAHGGSMDLMSSTDEEEHGMTVELRIPIG